MQDNRDLLESIVYQLTRIADALEDRNECNRPKMLSIEEELEMRIKNGQVNEND